jgi:hypothetical protein
MTRYTTSFMLVSAGSRGVEQPSSLRDDEVSRRLVEFRCRNASLAMTCDRLASCLDDARVHPTCRQLQASIVVQFKRPTGRDISISTPPIRSQSTPPFPTATTTTGATLWKVRSWRWSLLKRSFPLLSQTLGQMWVGK